MELELPTPGRGQREPCPATLPEEALHSFKKSLPDLIRNILGPLVAWYAPLLLFIYFLDNFLP